jgi:hypothetical protein
MYKYNLRPQYTRKVKNKSYKRIPVWISINKKIPHLNGKQWKNLVNGLMHVHKRKFTIFIIV